MSTITTPTLSIQAGQAACPAAFTAVAPRRYVYCIINSDGPKSFGPLGIGPDAPEVIALAHRSAAAVISATAEPKFEISRANLLAHQRVMERVMEAGCTVLPVKFNTIAEERPARAAGAGCPSGESAERRIVRCVLEPRQEELVELLATMSSRVEIGVKGLWPDMKAVYRRIVQEHREIDQFRRKVQAPGRSPRTARPGEPAGAMSLQVRLGEMVKAALEARKKALEKEMIGSVSPLAIDLRRNKVFGDPMFTNLSLLMEGAAMREFETALSAFEAAHAGSGEEIRLRCVGPVPPSNFVELVITWDEES